MFRASGARRVAVAGEPVAAVCVLHEMRADWPALCEILGQDEETDACKDVWPASPHTPPHRSIAIRTCHTHGRLQPTIRVHHAPPTPPLPPPPHGCNPPYVYITSTPLPPTALQNPPHLSHGLAKIGILVRAIGFRQWNHTTAPCFLCDCTLEQLVSVEGVSLQRAPWSDLTQDDYERHITEYTLVPSKLS
jgi:hypothetical protein